MIREAHNLLFGLFFERDISRKVSCLAELLKKHSSSDILGMIDSIDYANLEDLINSLDTGTRLLTLVSYCDLNNRDLSQRAMALLEANIEEVQNLERIEDKVKILKYIATHASKPKSKRAIRMLTGLVDELDQIKNIELVASTLRYIYVSNDDVQIRSQVLSKINQLENETIRETSLDYLREAGGIRG